MDRVDLTFFLRDDLQISTPRTHTPAGWITLGFHTDLREASLIALFAMLDLLEERSHIPRADAYALCSLIVDLRISQIVNAGVFGVHAVFPHNAFTLS